jgi:hypothetical protein
MYQIIFVGRKVQHNTQFSSAPGTQFYHLQLRRAPVGYAKAQQGTHMVPAMPARGAGVHVQAAQRFVVLHF